MSGMIGNRQVLRKTLSDHTLGETIARDGGMVKRNSDVPILEPQFPATECVEEPVQDVSAAESSGRKMSLLVNILRATLLPDYRCEPSVVHLCGSRRRRLQ